MFNRAKKLNHFIEQVHTGQLKAGSVVDLSGLGLHDFSWKKIIAVLHHPNFPINMKLDLSRNNFTNQGARRLLAELQNGEYKFGLRINLADNQNIDLETRLDVEGMLKAGQNIVQTIIPKNRKLYEESSSEDVMSFLAVPKV